jgi:formate-dependent nitrite reductase membrane component NrfD
MAPGTMAGALAFPAATPRETYNVGHRVPWHWQVPAYLVTKAIGAGTFLVAALGVALGVFLPASLFTTGASFLSLLFMGLTTGLLVWDLDRPERFWTILIRPQWRSWLARGAFILIGFSLVVGLHWLAYVLGWLDLAYWLALPGLALAVLSAVYTAFLFAQAEGRDLWQSTLLPAQFLAQAVMAGAATLLIGVALSGNFLMGQLAQGAVLGYPVPPPLVWTFGLSLLASLLLALSGEFGARHASQVAAAAAQMLTLGRYWGWYWGSLLGGLALPLMLVGLAPMQPAVLGLAAILSLAGLLAYEWAFVMAPQQVPNS